MVIHRLAGLIILPLVALGACKSGDYGHAVFLKIGAPALPRRGEITTLDISVSGVETFQKRYASQALAQGREEAVVYYPQERQGGLTFAVRAFDAMQDFLGSGKAAVTLSDGRTLTVTVALMPGEDSRRCGDPPLDCTALPGVNPASIDC